MLTLRTVTACLGVITVAVLYVTARCTTRDARLALLAALLLAIYPPAVLYSRFGFSYNLLAPLVLIAFLGLGEFSAHRSKRWLAVSALSIGLGTLSDLWMFIMLAPFALIVLIRNWRDGLWSVPLALLPFGIYAALMLLTAPQAFVFDLRFVLSRVNQLPFDRQVATLWQNVTTLAAHDAWLIAGVDRVGAVEPAAPALDRFGILRHPDRAVRPHDGLVQFELLLSHSAAAIHGAGCGEFHSEWCILAGR